MGANLILACVMVPRRFWGETLLAEMTARVSQLSEARVRGVADDLENLYGDLEGYTDDAGDLNLDAVRSRIIKAVSEVCSESRDSTYLEFGECIMLLTGGTSWGDTPSDAYNDFCLVEAADLFEQELGALRTSMSNDAVADACIGKCELIEGLYDYLMDGTESFEESNIGADFTYMVGAVIKGSTCQWPESRPFVHLLRAMTVERLREPLLAHIQIEPEEEDDLDDVDWEEQGWDAHSREDLYLEFISKHGLDDQLGAFLRRKAKEENEG